MTIIAPVDGDLVDPQWAQEITDAVNEILTVTTDMDNLLNKQMCRLRANATQSITTGAYASVLFNVEDLDDSPTGVGGHSTSVNTSRYTPTRAGWYTADGGCGFAASATGLRGLRWAKNGTAIDGSEIFMPPTASSTPVYTARGLSVFLNGTTDYIELQAFHSHGSNLSTTAGSTDQPSMTVTFERDA